MLWDTQRDITFASVFLQKSTFDYILQNTELVHRRVVPPTIVVSRKRSSSTLDHVPENIDEYFESIESISIV